MKQKLLNKLWLRVGVLVAIMTTALAGTAWGEDYEELFTIAAGSVVSGSKYQAHTATVNGRDYVVTFGGNNNSIGTNSGNRASCNLSKYAKYAVSPVTTSSVASAFACLTSIEDVSRITYTFNGGKNQTNTNVYLLYSSDNTTFSQVALTSGTQGATISSGTEYIFDSKTGYFALLFEATNSSGDWRIDAVNMKFYKASAGGSTLASIAVDVSGATNVFHVGDTFTHEGVVVTAIYEDESTKNVTANATYSTPDMTTAGTKEVTVSYTENNVEKTTSYNVEVKAPTSITLSGTYPTEFNQGDAFSHEGLIVTANYDGVTPKDVTEEVTFSTPDMTTIGTKAVTVTYGTLTATYNITVTEYVQPTEFDVNLNNALFGTSYNGSASGITDEAPASGTLNGVNVIYAGSGNHYINDYQIRFYPSNKLTFEAPDGYEIKSIVFTAASNTWAATISANQGVYTSETKTWIGSAASVLFTGSGNSRCDMSKATITLDVASSVAAPTFSVNSGTYYTPQSIEINCTTEGATIYYSTDNNNWVEYTEPISVAVTTTIYAKAVKNDVESIVSVVTYTISEKNDVVFNIAEKTLVYAATYNVTKGTSEGRDVQTDGYITISSSNPAVASVSGMTITANAVGATTITLDVAEGETYKSASSSFMVIVTAPEGKTTAMPNTAAIIFEEHFNSANGSGPSGDTWTGTQAIADFKADNEGWTSTGSMHSGEGCVKFGKTGEDGNGTTPTIAFDGIKTYMLTFKAGAWNGDNTTLVLSCNDENAVLGETSFTMEQNAWTEYSTTVKAAAGSTLTFTSTGNSYGRFFLDDVVITDPNATAPTISYTIPASGLGTFCSVYPLELSVLPTGVKAYKVTERTESTVKLAEVTENVKGGVGIVIEGPGNTPIEFTSVNCENVPSDNLLIGTLAPTYLAERTAYGLKDGEFHPNKVGTMRANRAYVPAGSTTATKALTLIFEDDATGITHTRVINDQVIIYDLIGRRLSKMQKGINIVNGKKILK